MPATNDDYQELLSKILVLTADLKARKYESFGDSHDFLIMIVQGLHDQLRNWLVPREVWQSEESTYQSMLKGMIEHLQHLQKIGYFGAAKDDQRRAEFIKWLEENTGFVYAMGAIEP